MPYNTVAEAENNIPAIKDLSLEQKKEFVKIFNKQKTFLNIKGVGTKMNRILLLAKPLKKWEDLYEPSYSDLNDLRKKLFANVSIDINEYIRAQSKLFNPFLVIKKT